MQPLQSIQSLRPNVSREEAEKAFGHSGARGSLRRFTTGPLRSLAEVYVPFRLYRVHIRNGGASQVQIVAIDEVRGILDLYSFDELPQAQELVEVSTRNRLLPSLSDEESEKAVVHKVQRTLFQTGFFRIRELSISLEALPLQIHVPYWVGFYGSGQNASLRVMDAVRRQMEGSKLRQLIKDWLAA